MKKKYLDFNAYFKTYTICIKLNVEKKRNSLFCTKTVENQPFAKCNTILTV